MKRLEVTKQVIEKWTGESGVKELYPPGSSSDLAPGRAGLLRTACKGLVCEVGCGNGRVATCFESDAYVGLDINPAALVLAQKRLPEHKFLRVEYEDPYPKADTYLFYTCLLHVPDEELPNVLTRLSGRVVVCESMARSFRKTGKEFQRDAEEYIEWFSRSGFEQVSCDKLDIPKFPFFDNILVMEKR